MTTTHLAPLYDPSTVERDIYQRWLAADAFAADPGSSREPYVIVIPPPNVTAPLHMGHGLNNTVQDVLIRYQRARGREAEWLPGMDHAGIATQNVIERQLAGEGLRRQELGRERFVERVWAFVKTTRGTIVDQLKAMGASCDWSRLRFTLDDGYSRAVRYVFVSLYRDGLIYRGHRVIHWCPRCHTSLSDEEAEFADTDGQLYHIRYPFADADGTRHVVVATTRPETMFGDVAVVYHPDDDRFADLAGREVLIPLTETRIPILKHAMVERDFGTGLLKVTPAHDANDFDIARDLLPDGECPIVMTEDARMADVGRVPWNLQGLDRFEARERIVEALEAGGLLGRVEPHRHAVRHCYRCDTVVEPRLSDQWFVRMQPLAEPALEAYQRGAVRFLPERWGGVYAHWLTGIRDWNISRQLWWGHRIPAWYCTAEGCDHLTVAESDPERCAACGGQLRQDEDVLDTWFSSWLWPFATFGWPEQTEDLARFYPGHTLVTGADIIFFWVARMIMGGLHFLGRVPFDTVYLNGIVRDPQHRAFSKSLGNGVDPMDVIARYGADALRFTAVAGASAGTDVTMDRNDLDTTFAAGRNFANKVWNLGRFILSHVDRPQPDPAALDAAQFELADRWILSRCQHAVTEVTEAYERLRLNDAASLAYHFLWDDVADWYAEQVKPRLYGKRPGGDTARAILLEVFATGLRLLHPVMPFITEALWSHVPGDRGLLAVTAWPRPRETLRDAEAEARFPHVQALVGAVRAVRAEYGVAPGRTVRAIIEPATLEAAEAFNAEQRTIEQLARVDPLLQNGDAVAGAAAHCVLGDGTAVIVPLGDAIDIDKECRRLGQELQQLGERLAGVEAKLANRQFTSRAPAEVVAREREKETTWREQRAALAEKLRILGC